MIEYLIAIFVAKHASAVFLMNIASIYSEATYRCAKF